MRVVPLRLRSTFALRGICRAVAKDVDLMHRPERLEKLPQLRLGPGARDLPHKHLDGVWVGLIQVFEGTVHLAAIAGRAKQTHKNRLFRRDPRLKRATVRSDRRGLAFRPSKRTVLETLVC